MGMSSVTLCVSVDTKKVTGVYIKPENTLKVKRMRELHSSEIIDTEINVCSTESTMAKVYVFTTGNKKKNISVGRYGNSFDIKLGGFICGDMLHLDMGESQHADISVGIDSHETIGPTLIRVCRGGSITLA